MNEFCHIVKQSARYIKRVNILPIDDAIVYGTVRSNSGLSEWNFTIDFNDYGHLTGKYWLQSDNEESDVPRVIAEKISALIRSFPDGFKQSQSSSKGTEYDNSNATVTDSCGNETESKHFDKMWQAKKVVKKAAKKKAFKDEIKVFACLALLSVLLGIFAFVFYLHKETQKFINVTVASTEAVGADYDQIVEKLEEAGFTNIYIEPEYDLEIENIEDEGKISGIKINGDSEFDDLSQYPYDAKIDIIFHALKNIEVPVSAKTAKKMNFAELEAMLKNAGFVNIRIEKKYDLITGWITKDGTVDEISINGDTVFSENAAYRPDAEIIIVYHTFKRNAD